MDWGAARVLLTGGTGTFGHAFTRSLLSRFPGSRVRIYSRDEWKQQAMAAGLGTEGGRVELWLGDVRDAPRLAEAASGCDVWVHAAALKQIPACEAHPLEAFKTNLWGTAHLMQAAEDLRPRAVVCLSTDKAVEPANVYGASKMGAERLAVAAGRRLRPGTCVCVVRYGNVLGSRGSVVPRFRAAREGKGSLPITDPRMTRFWLPQERAVESVVRAPALARGGEILIPKARSMRLADLARSIAPAAATETVGARPGEKIHETLLSEEEAGRALELDDLYVVFPSPPGEEEMARFPGARRLPEGFRYRSDTNPAWWSAEEIRPLLDA